MSNSQRIQELDKDRRLINRWIVILLVINYITAFTLLLLVRRHEHALVKTIEVFTVGLFLWPMLPTLILILLFITLFKGESGTATGVNIKNETLRTTTTTTFLTTEEDRTQNLHTDSQVILIAILISIVITTVWQVRNLVSESKATDFICEELADNYGAGSKLLFACLIKETSVDYDAFIKNAKKNETDISYLTNKLIRFMDYDSTAYPYLGQIIKARLIVPDSDQSISILEKSLLANDTVTTNMLLGLAKFVSYKNYPSIVNAMIRSGNVNMAKKVLAKVKESLHNFQIEKCNYLKDCIDQNKPQIMGVFIEAGAEIKRNAWSRYNEAFDLAIKKEDCEAIRVLVKHNPDLATRYLSTIDGRYWVESAKESKTYSNLLKSLTDK